MLTNVEGNWNILKIVWSFQTRTLNKQHKKREKPPFGDFSRFSGKKRD